MSFEILLELICGLCWTITYILIIIKSLKDKTYGIPYVAFCLNLAWEFTFLILHKPTAYPIAKYVFIPWLVLDLFVLYIFFKYGYKEFHRKYNINRTLYILFTLFSIICSVIIMYLFAIDFSPLYKNDVIQAGGFIANCQNLIMSVLFVYMLLDRKNLRGQSIYIAIFKWVGTLAIAILKFKGILPFIPGEIFVIFLIQVFDIMYIALLFKFNKSLYS
ncbi:hypothetical protein CHL78_007715 [Romboutsia weinsteinii]|uniref:Uncharacterized protein n=1 Tax=Romboutsia weinsteinii TaxID=2020949 RepID=A0A371J519_9FIRM|nr:hypothetical protein [Romboutsia weinsteinii]RDY27882.1 hypothetical protein CHL78_007715 [Romboutsia weinsteinii]